MMVAYSKMRGSSLVCRRKAEARGGSGRGNHDNVHNVSHGFTNWGSKAVIALACVTMSAASKTRERSRAHGGPGVIVDGVVLVRSLARAAGHSSGKVGYGYGTQGTRCRRANV